MSTWVYFAAEAQANEEDTIGFAMMQNVLWRSARNIRGNRIANVRAILRPGDTILLVYRQGRPHVARVVARIAETARPVLGTAVIERFEPRIPSISWMPASAIDNHNAVEVIHLEDVTECEIVLHGAYPGQVAIHRLASEDANVVILLAVQEEPRAGGAGH